MATDATVIAALRLAVVGAPNTAATAKIARLLLGEAPETAPDDTTGPALLVDLLRKGKLTAQLTSEPRA